MTCGVTVLDGTVTSAFARRQGVQSTSSGEAEFYGATAVVMDGRIVKHFLEWLGYAVVLYQLCLDSSAAKAMVQRDGVGKVKHLDTRALWIQAERRDHGLTTRKVPGEKNLADLGTKAHPAKRFLELRAMMGIVDCKQIDNTKEIEACSVEAASGEASNLSWTVQKSHGAARLERKLLLTLLAGAPAVSDAGAIMKMSAQGTAGGGATVVEHETGFGWLGWCVAALVTILFLARIVSEKYEARRQVRTRTMMTQSPTTYRTDLTPHRYQPLAEGSFGAWPMANSMEELMQGRRDL